MTTAISGLHTARARREPDGTVEDQISTAFWVIFCIAAVFGLTTANPLLTSVSLLVPPTLYSMLWKRGESPVLLFAAGFQWLQSFFPILACDLNSSTLSDSFGGPELETATWLTMLGVVVLSFGMRHATASMRQLGPDELNQQARALSTSRLLWAYILCNAISFGLHFVGTRVAALRVPFLSLANVHWMPVILILWHGIQAPRQGAWLMNIVIAIELFVGLTGFFAGFKTIIFFMVIVYASARSPNGRLPLARIAAVCILGLTLAAYWQAVKPKYRLFLNQRSKSQSVKVSLSQRVAFLANALSEASILDMEKGLNNTVERLGYVLYFGHAIQHVPKYVPYQNGDLWLGALTHIVTPRILFPNKPPISDSRRTRQFTGVRVADETTGTSISIGYIGESYIDFGPFGMFVPIYLLGWLNGLLFRWFTRIRGCELLGFATVSCYLLSTSMFIEFSNIKIVGGLTACSLVLGGALALWRHQLWEALLPRD